MAHYQRESHKLRWLIIIAVVVFLAAARNDAMSRDYELELIPPLVVTTTTTVGAHTP